MLPSIPDINKLILLLDSQKNLSGSLTFDNQLKRSFLAKEPHGHFALVAARVWVRHFCKFRFLVQLNVILPKQKHVSRASGYIQILPRLQLFSHQELLPLSRRPLLLQRNQFADWDPKFRRHSWPPFQRGLKWRLSLQARGKNLFQRADRPQNGLLFSIQRIW